MDTGLYPLSPEYFRLRILPVIESNYIWKGRPPTISHYQVFCAILYVLRTGNRGVICRVILAAGIVFTSASGVALGVDYGGYADGFTATGEAANECGSA